jgi:hypothetical protein
LAFSHRSKPACRAASGISLSKPGVALALADPLPLARETPSHFAPHAARGKNEACRTRRLIGRYFRPIDISQAATCWGKKMATIPMITVGPVTTLNRSTLRTERRMSGTGVDDFICGHCRYVMLENFDPSTVRGNPVYQCAYCENNNDLPFTATDRRYWSG